MATIGTDLHVMSVDLRARFFPGDGDIVGKLDLASCDLKSINHLHTGVIHFLEAILA